MPVETDVPAARAFVRSLNILLKFARLYGLEHARAADQFDSAWVELRSALSLAGDSGLLLGASGAELLLDGEPLETTPAERSFAQLLTTAGVASIGFTRELTRDAFILFVRAFAQAGVRAAGLSENLKAALEESQQPGIHINEIRFVAEDAASVDARVAAELTAQALGADPSQLKELLKNPEKLIQLIIAAEGAGRSAGVAMGIGAGGISGSATGSASGFTGWGNSGGEELAEEDVQSLIRLLVQIGEVRRGKASLDDLATWKGKFASLPAPARVTLWQTLSAMAAAAPGKKLDEPALLQLAQDLAIRFALTRFERGEVRVNAVRQLLDRFGKEIEALRKLLHAQEDKLSKAGIAFESYADVLDREFWASMPESGKRSVLLSPEGWCVPPRNVQQYVEELLGRGESDMAENILLRYASCVRNRDVEARRKVAIGLGQLAEIYSRAASRRLEEAIREIGTQLTEEREPELQTLLSAAFVRLSQEAAYRRYFRAMRQALDSLDKLEESRPSWTEGLRPRIGIVNRVPEFLEEALNNSRVSAGLAEVLRRIPSVAAEHLSSRLMRSSRRAERERLVEFAHELGAECVQHLRDTLRIEPVPKAVTATGLLSRLDPHAVENLLPERLREGHRVSQDAALHQLSVAGAPERGRILCSMLDLLDPLVVPLALDEIGMAGDDSVAPTLVRLVEGEILPGASDYLRVKAIEALGRLRATSAREPLRRILESRRAWRWDYPKELRMAAAQALTKLDREWAEAFLPHSGLDRRLMSLAPLDPLPERDFVRYRRYSRISLARPVSAVVNSSRGRYEPSIQVLSLEGGLLDGQLQLAAGSEAALKIPSWLQPIRLDVMVRFVRSHQAGVEVVGMSLEDRARLRRLLVFHSTLGTTASNQPRETV